MSCAVGCRHGLDLAWLCLWHRAVVTAWEPPYATGAALKRQKRQKKKKKKKRKEKERGREEERDGGEKRRKVGRKKLIFLNTEVFCF